MTTTNTNKRSAAVDTSNVIPFPDRRAARKPPEEIKSRTFSLPLRQVVVKVKDTVARFVRSANPVGVQRERASATREPEYGQPTYQNHGGSVVRRRMSV